MLYPGTRIGGWCINLELSGMESEKEIRFVFLEIDPSRKYMPLWAFLKIHGFSRRKTIWRWRSLLLQTVFIPKPATMLHSPLKRHSRVSSSTWENCPQNPCIESFEGKGVPTWVAYLRFRRFEIEFSYTHAYQHSVSFWGPSSCAIIWSIGWRRVFGNCWEGYQFYSNDEEGRRLSKIMTWPLDDKTFYSLWTSK